MKQTSKNGPLATALKLMLGKKNDGLLENLRILKLIFV
jgi:hypothetical protein